MNACHLTSGPRKCCKHLREPNHRKTRSASQWLSTFYADSGTGSRLTIRCSTYRKGGPLFANVACRFNRGPGIDLWKEPTSNLVCPAGANIQTDNSSASGITSSRRAGIDHHGIVRDVLFEFRYIHNESDNDKNSSDEFPSCFSRLFVLCFCPVFLPSGFVLDENLSTFGRVNFSPTEMTDESLYWNHLCAIGAFFHRRLRYGFSA